MFCIWWHIHPSEAIAILAAATPQEGLQMFSKGNFDKPCSWCTVCITSVAGTTCYERYFLHIPASLLCVASLRLLLITFSGNADGTKWVLVARPTHSPAFRSYSLRKRSCLCNSLLRRSYPNKKTPTRIKTSAGSPKEMACWCLLLARFNTDVAQCRSSFQYCHCMWFEIQLSKVNLNHTQALSEEL